MSDQDRSPRIESPEIGLCAGCRHLRRQPTARGAVFYRCARADEDERFMRYPPMPVRSCQGFEPTPEG